MGWIFFAFTLLILLLAVFRHKPEPSEEIAKVRESTFPGINRQEDDQDRETPPEAFESVARLEIHYRDADGKETKREIRAHHYLDSSPGHIYARCTLARAERQFRTDRIVQAIDLETGEILKRIPTFMRSKRVINFSPPQQIDGENALDLPLSPKAIPVKTVLVIDYMDAQGKQTTREVHVDIYDPAEDTIHGYCFLIGKRRAFRVDRISRAIDGRTGQDINRLRSYLRGCKVDTS